METHTLTLNLPPTYSLATLADSHGWSVLPPFNWDGATLSYVGWQGATIYRVAIQQQDEQQLQVDYQSQVPLDPAALVPGWRWMLCLDDDLSAFYALCQSEPHLAHLPRMGGGRLLRSPRVWEDLVKTITTTNTAWSGTIRMCHNLVNHFGTAGAFPAPNHLASATIDTLQRDGGLGYRAAYVHDLAQAIQTEALDLEAWKLLPTEPLYQALRRIRGVGDYAAAVMLMLLGHYERVPVDSIARASVSAAFYGGHPVTPAQIAAPFEQFAPYAALAYWFWKFED